jgi:CubicO group peptidase (beta-lactamase class C family)
LKKLLKYSVFTIVFLLFLVNIIIIGSGKSYIYKGIALTYLVGKTGPDIDDYVHFPKNKISNGIAQPWNLASDYNTQMVSDSSISAMEHFETVSYLVIKDDSIRFEKYWEGYEKNSLSNSFSMAKTILSILTGAAIKEGKINSIDQPVSDFIPEFKNNKKSAITIRHLLTMSSGIEFDEHYSSPFAYPAAAYYGTDLRALTLKYELGNEKPGTIFRYLSGDTQLLAFVLTAATGKSLSDYASEMLWQPMGAEHMAYWSTDIENGTEKAYCCFISNARDFARFGKLYLNKGNWNGNQIIDSAYVEESIKPANLLDREGNQNNKYGLKWWLIPDYRGLDIFYARGILGQYIVCIPEKNMLVVRLGHKRMPKPTDDHPADLFVYIDAALKMYE